MTDTKQFITEDLQYEILNKFYIENREKGILSKEDIIKLANTKNSFLSIKESDEYMCNPYWVLSQKPDLIETIIFGFKNGLFFTTSGFYEICPKYVSKFMSSTIDYYLEGPRSIEIIGSYSFFKMQIFKEQDLDKKYFWKLLNSQKQHYSRRRYLSDEVDLISSLIKLFYDINQNKKEEGIKNKIKEIDDNLNEIMSIDFPKPTSFKSNVIENEQNIIEKLNFESLHKFVKISSFLDDVHRNLFEIRANMRAELDPKDLLKRIISKIEEEEREKSTIEKLDEIQDRLSRFADNDYKDKSSNGILKELLDATNQSIPAFSKEIVQVAYLEAMANSMLLFLLNNKQILYFEILEVFEKLGALDSSWQKSVSEKMDRLENKLNLIIGGLLNLNNSFERLLEKNDDIIKSLESIDSSIKSTNMLQAINAYQVYRINKNTKSIT